MRNRSNRSLRVLATLSVGTAIAQTLILIIASIITLSVFSTGTRARDVGALGGGGGAPFRSTCRPGDVMIGFGIRIGKALDRIRVLCVVLNEQKTGFTKEHYYLQPHGGSGGEPWGLGCNVGYAVRHLHVFMDRHKMVNHIRLTCQHLTSGQSYEVVPEKIGGQAVGDVRFSCGQGEWATGVYGRSGNLIDQIGLSCEKLASSSSPSSGPKIKPLGKGNQQTGFDARADCKRRGGTYDEGVRFCFGASISDKPQAIIRASEARCKSFGATWDSKNKKCVDTRLPPPKFCTVEKPSDVYDASGGAGQKIAELAAGTPNVTLLGKDGPHWYHVKWPAGQGWVFSGPGYEDALKCP